MNTALDLHDLSPPRPHLRRAAYFGLDQTLIPGSSLFLLAQGLRERNLYGGRQLMRFTWDHLRYRVGPADTEPQIESSTEAALAFVAGRNREDVEALTREIAGERILPTVFPSMALLVDHHRAAGDLTFTATAAPAELARVVADELNMTGGFGTRAEVEATGRYSGRLAGEVLRGPVKAEAVRAHAEAAGIDLLVSSAYSDSINDLPLLELVGRPGVVNPDDELRRVAAERDWTVHELDRQRRDRHRTPAHTHRRVVALGLSSPLRPQGATSGRNHHFTTDDPEALVRELEASGRFRRDTRMGRLFHPGQVSLREVAARDGLHVILGEGNRVVAHIDHVSPLSAVQPEVGCRYSLPKIAAHNVVGMAADLLRLIPRRRRQHNCCPESRNPASPRTGGSQH